MEEQPPLESKHVESKHVETEYVETEYVATRPAGADDAPIDVDARCIRCGYNLRGMRPSMVCPECGHDVAPSLVGDRLADADEVWLKGVVRGQKLLAFGLTLPILAVIASIGLMITISIVGSTTDLWFSVWLEQIVSWGALAGILGGLAAAVAGAFLITSLEPRESETEKVTSNRLRARAAMVATIAGVIATFGSAYAPVAIEPWLTPAVELLATLIFTAAIVASLRVLIGYASRIPDADLVKKAEVAAYRFRWMLPVVAVMSAADDYQVSQIAQGTVLEPVIQLLLVVGGCMTAVFVLVLFFQSISLVMLMGRFKRAFAAVQEQRAAGPDGLYMPYSSS